MRSNYFISQKKRLASLLILTFILAIGAFLNGRVVHASSETSDKIIFIDSAGSGLWQIDPDGQNKVRLADAPSTNSLVLSPDGQSLAYTTVGDKIGLLYIMGIDGKNAQLVKSNQDKDGNNAEIATVSWSPDGTRLLYAQWGTDYKLALHSANLDGSDEQAIPFEPLAQFQIILLSWSPDGEHILVYGTNDQHKVQAVIFNLDGTIANVLYEGDNLVFSAAIWSPDGAEIAYTIKSEDLTSTLYIADADGSNVHSVTSGTEILRDMAWSPDKSQIAFWGYPKTSFTKALFIIGVDGTNLHSLPLDGFGLVWTTIPA